MITCLKNLINHKTFNCQIMWWVFWTIFLTTILLFLNITKKLSTFAPPRSSIAAPPGDTEENQTADEGHIRIRLKYLDDRQRLVQARPQDTVGQFKQYVSLIVYLSTVRPENISDPFIWAFWLNVLNINEHQIAKSDEFIQLAAIVRHETCYCLKLMSEVWRPPQSEIKCG